MVLALRAPSCFYYLLPLERPDADILDILRAPYFFRPMAAATAPGLRTPPLAAILFFSAAKLPDPAPAGLPVVVGITYFLPELRPLGARPGERRNGFGVMGRPDGFTLTFTEIFGKAGAGEAVTLVSLMYPPNHSGRRRFMPEAR